MKAICSERGWSYDEDMPATKLIKVLAREGLFPEKYLDPKVLEQFVGFLKAALPKVRNKGGAHGKSPNHPPLPPYLASFALHEAAAYVLMMIEALDALSAPAAR